jgi:hypothetical protein
MNRPYYALAALVAMLTGSTVAIGPARCQSATAQVATSSRSLCGLTARDYVVAANLFVHFEAGSDAGEAEDSSANEQGSEIVNDVPGYPYTCGYDPCRGEMYEADLAVSDNAEEVDYWSLYNDSAEESLFVDGTDSRQEEQEAWPTDARVDERYLNFERCNPPTQCGGEQHCPYFGGRSWFGGDYDCWVAETKSQEDNFDYWTAYQEEVDYWTLYQEEVEYWTLYQEEVEYWTLYGSDYDYWTAYPSSPSSDELVADYQDDWDCQVCYPTYREDAESAENLANNEVETQAIQDSANTVAAHVQQMLAQLDGIRATIEQEAWKTRAVAMPNWIEEYVAEPRNAQDNRQIELEYAQAELQAALEAGEPIIAENSVEYGPSLPAAPSPDRVSYNDEYESLYDLDAILVGEDDSEAMDDEAQSDSPVCQLLGRIFSQGCGLINLVPNLNDDADDLLDSADIFIELMQEASLRACEWQKVADRSQAYHEYASLIEYDQLMVESVQHMLPPETTQSRNLLQSVANSLRLTGAMLLVAADSLEAEAARVLSARTASPLAR